MKIEIRYLFVLTMLLGTFVFAGRAEANGSTSPDFLLNPSFVGTTQPYVWPTAYNTNGNYPRNVYWDFNQNPFAVPDQNEITYGSADAALAPSDTFIATGDVKWNQLPAQIGVADNNQSGTAVYTFAPKSLSDTNNMAYIWAEINVSTTGSSGNFVSFAGLSNVVSSELFLNNYGANPDTGTLLTKNSSGLFSYNLTGNFSIYNAYFAIKDPGSTENLTLDFNTTDGTAFVNSLHVATVTANTALTPEPVSMALFAIGAMVLLFMNRRRLGLQFYLPKM